MQPVFMPWLFLDPVLLKQAEDEGLDQIFINAGLD
jgi:hypothetical protein